MGALFRPVFGMRRRLFRLGLDLDLDQNLRFALAQREEFAYVLFSFATQNGVVSTGVAGPLVAARGGGGAGTSRPENVETLV